ncbi:MAG TPA: molybdenum cofactor biosynthesis protein MoaE [Bdellovibrionota bacterium]|nr:molybdenum cofactor biosynthesis protein MoaE [Bdellovibrionota bacterium]
MSGDPREPILTEITERPISLQEVAALFQQDEATGIFGAEVFFSGIVRARNAARNVIAISYDAFVPLAEKVLREIACEARQKAQEAEAGEVRIVALHRIGKLHVGEVSLVIGVGAAHREQAYGASRYVLEEIKTRLPVWKKEHYDSGEAEWLKGHPLG